MMPSAPVCSGDPSERISGAPPASAVGLIGVAFAGLVLGSGLDAYAIGPVPIPWLVLAGALTLAGLLAVWSGRVTRVPGDVPLLLFLGWSAVVGLGNLIVHDAHARAMPSIASTPHGVFIILRVLEYIVFLAVAQVTFWLLLQGRLKLILRSLSVAGTVLAIAALYMYVAPLYGLPEPPRTRLGTGGVPGQIVEFTYAFHRALGTFREPSHLAEWLVVPLFASIALKGRWLNFQTVVMAWALLLSGSLTGIIGAVGGLLIATAMRIRSLTVLMPLAKFMLVLAAALVLFDLMVRGYGDGMEQGIISVLVDRIQPILFGGGMTETNRGFVYDYMAENAPLAFGAGLGNSNIQLSEALGRDVMSTFLSHYFNVLYALGPIGLVLLCLVLAAPIVAAVRLREESEHLILFLAAYVGWLIMFAVHAESMAFMFAVAYVLLLHAATPGASRPADAPVMTPGVSAASGLSLARLGALLRRRRKVLVAVPLVAMFIMVSIAATRPRTYTAHTTFVRQTDRPVTRGGQALLLLARDAGERLRVRDYYADLVRSREVLERLADLEFDWSTEAGPQRGTLVEYYGGGRALPARESAVLALQRDVTVTARAGTPILGAAATTRDPALSRQIVERLVVTATEFDGDARRARARAEVGLLEDRLREAQGELERSERALLTFIRANPTAPSPALQLERDRLQRQVVLTRSRVAEVTQSLTLAKMLEIRAVPAITVVDRPGDHVPANSRPLLEVAILSLMYGLILSLVAILLHELLSRVRGSRRAGASNSAANMTEEYAS
jgi:hypothetical protein